MCLDLNLCTTINKNAIDFFFYHKYTHTMDYINNTLCSTLIYPKSCLTPSSEHVSID